MIMEFNNNLNRNINRTGRLPSFIRPLIINYIIGKTVKLVGTAGIRFEKLACEEVIASLNNQTKVQNHIGQIHAAATTLLAETATGIVVGMNIPDHSLPLMKSLSIKFVKRSEGRQKAVARLNKEQIREIRETERGDLMVPVTVTDESGEEVIKAEMLWAWIPKKKKEI
jgi:acyl-coenzyme A thioesterase PaaI-like protein